MNQKLAMCIMNGGGGMAKNKITIDGMDDVISQLREIGGSTDEAIGAALYDGAGVVADELARQIDSISVRPDGAWGTPSKPVYGLTAAQKRGLQKSLGVAKHKDENGVRNTKIGWDGYNEDGQPNAMIARSLNAGTSWLKKDRIIDRAVSASKQSAEAAMKKKVEEEIEKCL